jgi:subtilase family serine protease
MRRNIIFVVIALLLIGASLVSVRMLVYADANQRLALNSDVMPLLQRAHLLQAADPQQQLHLSIGLQLRNSAELDRLLNAFSDPRSAQYHHYLTPAMFNLLFAPTPGQVRQVVSFLQSQGFTVTAIASNNQLIDATGSVAQAQQAFNTRINNYRLGGHTFYANATAPSLPVSLIPLVTSIGGLDNSLHYQPHYRRLNARSAAPGGYTPDDLATAYDATPLQNAGFLGDGQAVALFELDGYQSGDVAQYFQAYNLGNPSITNVLVDGFNGSAGQSAIETELDIEVTAAMAPHARQIVYEGPNTTQGLNDTYNRIVTDHKARIAVVSWGICESSSGPGELQILDNIFKQAAAQGISFFAASGDAGAYDCGDGNPAVDSPASDPYVTGVGGTNLQLNSGAYDYESVWSNPKSKLRSPKGAGSGGGISNTFKLPPWQSGPGVDNQYSNGNRQVPDVTADADPATGYSIYCTVMNAGCPSSGWITVGGTSPAAPLWAGSMALINQYLRADGKARVGFANPTLYRLFNVQQAFPAFHDITDGTNLLYSATTGYDLASGLGSPDIYNIARDLDPSGSAPSINRGATRLAGPAIVFAVAAAPTTAAQDT